METDSNAGAPGTWRLYWSSRSPFVRQVTFAAIELGLIDRIQIEPALVNPWQPNADVMAVNPLGMLPTLTVEPGRHLYDSRVIIEFLGRTAGAGYLCGETSAEREDIGLRQALANDFMQKLLKALDERYRQTQNDENEARRQAIVPALNAMFDWMNDRAGAWTRPLPDAGDIACFCALGYADFRFADLKWRENRDALAAWFDRIAARPAAERTGHSA